MSGRYTRLYDIEKNLYIQGSPIIICAGALHKDNNLNRIVAQLSFKNISEKKIKSITVILELLDGADRVLGKTEYTYLDLAAERGQAVGQKELILIKNDSTRAFNVLIKEVIFTDKTVWVSDDVVEWESLKGPVMLEKELDEELVEQYLKECHADCLYIPLKQKDIWYCSCGAVNHENEEKCYVCGFALAELIEKYDKEKLTKNYENCKLELSYDEANMLFEAGKAKKDIKNLRLAQKGFGELGNFKDADMKFHECVKLVSIISEEERKKEEERNIKNKKIMKIATLLVVLVIALMVGVTLLNQYNDKNNKYNEAVVLVNEGKFDMAIKAFEELGDFKDSREKLSESKEKQMEKLEELYEPKYLIGIELAENGEYYRAIRIFESLKKVGYKDSAERLAELVRTE